MKKRKLHWLLCLVVILIGLTSVAAVVAKRAGSWPSNNITITNNSSLDIKHVYFSHVGQNDWTSDQLNDNSISSGGSRTLKDVSWDQPNIHLIAEDQNGCFLYQTIALAEDASWTIAADATGDCGGN